MLDNKNQQRIGLDNNSAGFTLIELMISLAVFTIGIVATLGLALSNYNNSQDNLDKLIAANLAREGIELVKNVRDSNWLRADNNKTVTDDEISCNGGALCTWDSGLSVASNGYAYMNYNDTFPTAFSCVGSITDCASVANCLNCVLYQDASAFYNNDNSGVVTKYSRVLFLEKICVDETSANPEGAEYLRAINLSCTAGDTYIGIQVTSHVQWQDNGPKSVELVDRLYNWRR